MRPLMLAVLILAACSHPVLAPTPPPVVTAPPLTYPMTPTVVWTSTTTYGVMLCHNMDGENLLCQ